MVLRCASLGSGSKGNATLIETDGVSVLVDCGFSAREAVRRLAALGRCPEDIDAILVTHEHTDHIRGVAALSRHYRIPVYLTRGTQLAASGEDFHQTVTISCHSSWILGDLSIEPFPVPHDAREPCQFAFSNAAGRLGLLTDVGSITPHIVAKLARCDALLLECNYEPQQLFNGSYPESLKRRIDGAYGHLSNGQAAALLGRLDRSRLRYVIGLHLSEQNNTPEAALASLRGVLEEGRGSPPEVRVAHQDGGFGWLEIG